MILRDKTFDAMKGLAILAVIIGHSTIPELLEKFIFVWHMPLFFIISGYFYKSYPNKEYIKKNIRQLVSPYVLTSLTIISCTILRDFIIGERIRINYIIGALVGNGTSNNPTFSEYSIGAIWFLLALCWCRIIYNMLVNCISDTYQRNVILVCISICATYVGTIVFIPTNLLQGMQALLFFHIGYLWRKGQILSKRMKPSYLGGIIVFTLCFLSVISGSMSMVRCYYGYFPINFMAAIAMTIGVYRFSILIQDLYISQFLVYCGRISLVVLCVHDIEMICRICPNLQKVLLFPTSCDFSIHLLVTLVCSFLLVQFKCVRNFFNLQM